MSVPRSANGSPGWSTNRVLGVVVLPTVLLANLLCAAWPDPSNHDIAAGATVQLLRGHAKHDSWGPMRAAIEQLNAAPGQPLYQTLFFEKKTKFQYPPSSLLPVMLAMHLPPALQKNDRALNAVSFVAVWLTAFLCGLILLRVQPYVLEPRHRRATILLTGALALLFYPLVKAYTLGQIQAWLNALFAAAVYCWLTDRPRLAGALVGLVCMTKPQLLLLVLWSAIRRRWEFARACLAVIVVVGVISVLKSGWRVHFEYLSVLSFIGRRGEVFLANQSMNGLLNRLVAGSQGMRWDANGFPAYVPLVYAGTLLTSGVLMGVALLWRQREHKAASVIDLCIAGLTFTVASPVAWEHHFGILAPIFALSLPLFREYRPLGRGTMPLLLVSFVLASSSIPPTRLLVEWPGNLLQSTLFFAVLLLLGMLYALRRAMHRAPEFAWPDTSRPPAPGNPSPP